jgi:hypothetical protein
MSQERMSVKGDVVIVHGRFSGFGLPVNWIAADSVRVKDGVLAGQSGTNASGIDPYKRALGEVPVPFQDGAAYCQRLHARLCHARDFTLRATL